MGKSKSNLKAHVPVRLNILFFVVFILFSALILRLGFVQIVQGEDYQEQLERTINISSPVEAPRGLMYDRYGNVVVDNELQLTVTFTNRRTSSREILETARKLNQYITVEQENPNQRDMRDFFLLINDLSNEEYDVMLELLTVDEPYEVLSFQEQRDLGLDDQEAYEERLRRIGDEQLDLITDEGWEVFGIWREFIAGYNYLPHKVSRGVTYEEAALIMENMEDLPGVDIVRDSARSYPYEDSLRGIFGRVGSIQRESLDQYLANGYNRNDLVGNSYLEQQYESVLRGRSGSLNNYMDRSGEFLRNPEEVQGKRGNDLILGVDMELQQRVEEIVADEISSSAHQFVGDEQAYVVMMDPHTGDVLSMVGHGENVNDSSVTQFATEAGSSIKGATVLTGYETGVFAHGEQIVDRTIDQLPDTPSISSVRALGRINDIQALERSSNIYMAEVGMRLINYIPGVSGTNWGDYVGAYNTLRYYYSQFGLGVETGIDLPSEVTGLKGSTQYPGQMLFLTFGQYDTYTPIQLAQYTSVIANGGYRVAPRLVTEIREPGENKHELGALNKQFEPKVLNRIDMSDQDLARVQQGFYQVMHGSEGTARSYFRNLDYDVAGKTGTAQVTVDGESANNQTLVGYAPYDNPEVAFSIVVPGVQREDAGGIANRIGRDIMEAYFELKDNRPAPGDPSEQLYDDEDLGGINQAEDEEDE
ncbi:penicillin-binding protein [Alteribacter lacisalsi]|uniref:serine-type D-Ala-D-Ala carboxypeptidase n=1 Tax=Alteribacter lacisalsi TaxID=2045244 RepID=A0A2W0HE43_9BACI|nr:penicillin-binding protein 2 [Alteribacter lacisalsi]PYZ99206.1 penicillin-binding protein [Alteribacter lacisalsi]